MKELPRFIKIGDDRINVDDIAGYGLDTDIDEHNVLRRYLYVEMKTGDYILQYLENEVDFNIDDKLGDLDKLLLIDSFERVDFQ